MDPVSRPRGARRRHGGLLVLLAVLAATAACVGPREGSGPPGSLTLITSTYPTTWLAQRIAGPDARIANVAEASADPHHLELTPRQVIDIHRADLVLYIRGLQEAMDEAVDQHAKPKALDVASAVGEHGTGDPHVWLDPVRFANVAVTLGDRLAAVDPAHADGYRRRAEDTAQRLRELHDAYASALRGCDSAVLVTSHQSFAYLAQRYGFRHVAVAGSDPEAVPSPGRIAEVARMARSHGVDVVFHDESGGDELAGVVASEIGGRTAPLDPVTDSPAPGDGGYLAAMRSNLATLRDALGCS